MAVFNHGCVQGKSHSTGKNPEGHEQTNQSGNFDIILASLLDVYTSLAYLNSAFVDQLQH